MIPWLQAMSNVWGYKGFNFLASLVLFHFPNTSSRWKLTIQMEVCQEPMRAIAP